MNKYSGAFLAAVNMVLKHEGGFNNIKEDKGGATNYGISLRYLRSQNVINGDIDGDGDIDWHDIEALSQDQAIKIYHDDWWQRYSYEAMPLSVGRKVFDMAINMGAIQAHKLLQRAINATQFKPPLVVDGVLGIKTRDAINAIPVVELMAQLRMTQEDFYRDLVAKNSSLKKFLKGWIKRANT